MVTFSIHGEKGHIYCAAYGDDEKIHLTAHRRQSDRNGIGIGSKVVEIGKYSVSISELETFLAEVKQQEARFNPAAAAPSPTVAPETEILRSLLDKYQRIAQDPHSDTIYNVVADDLEETLGALLRKGRE